MQAVCHASSVRSVSCLGYDTVGGARSAQCVSRNISVVYSKSTARTRVTNDRDTMGNVCSGWWEGAQHTNDPVHRFCKACRRNDVNAVRHLKDAQCGATVWLGFRNGYGFVEACRFGSMRVIVEMLMWTGDCRIDVHWMMEEPFRSACECGQLEVVQLLLTLDGDRRVDVHAMRDTAFREACYRNETDVVGLLLSLEGDRRIPNAAVQRAVKLTCLYSGTERIDTMLLEEGVRRDFTPQLMEEVFQYACLYGQPGALGPLLKMRGKYRIRSVNSVNVAVANRWEECSKVWRRVVPSGASVVAVFGNEDYVTPLAHALHTLAAWERRADMLLLRRVVRGPALAVHT